MSVAALTEQAFELHEFGVAVCAHELAVIDAMDLRLRDFRSDGRPDAELRFEFSIDSSADPEPPPEPAREPTRPVYDTPHGTLYYSPGDDTLCGRLGGVELRCAAGRGVALFHASAYAGRDLYLATHPLATISLMELLERRGLFALHAACLASDQGHGVLLAGVSGAGKSTLALALAQQGMRFLSDDIVFLAAEPGSESDTVRVLGFADTVGLTDHAARCFPRLDALHREPPAPGFPKRLRRIEELFGAPAVGACQPHALVFPEVSPGAPSRIDPLDPGEAMLRLVPDVLLTHPASTQAHLRAIAALLRQVRCYSLRSGSDLERAAALVRGLV